MCTLDMHSAAEHMHTDGTPAHSPIEFQKCVTPAKLGENGFCVCFEPCDHHDAFE